MTAAEIQKIIDQFDENSLDEQGYLGFFYEERESDGLFIKANQAGFERFALQVLLTLKRTKEMPEGTLEQIIPLDVNAAWIDEDSDAFPRYIQIIRKKPLPQPEVEAQASSFADKLMPYGCGVVVIILVLTVLVGLYSMIKWVL